MKHIDPDGNEQYRGAHRAAGHDKTWTSGDKKFLGASLLVHVLVVIALLGSWSFSESVKPVHQPASIQARVLTSEEMEALRASAEKVRKQERAKKQAEQDRIRKERQRKEAERERKKQQEAAKKKKAQEKARLKKQEEAKILKEKQKAEDKKRKAEKLKQEQEERAKELALQEERERAQEKQRELERERRLAERLAAVNELEEADSVSESASLSQTQISEKDRFAALIRSRVEARWHIPPKSKGLRVVLEINLLPSGESSGIRVISSSGNKAFDTSALNAARSVRVFPVPADAALFDAYFRKLNMSFSPPDE